MMDELQMRSLDDQVDSDRRKMERVSGFLKSQARDVETLRCLYAQAVSKKKALDMPSRTEQINSLVHKAEQMRTAVSEIRSDDNSEWCKITDAALLDYITRLRDWKNCADIIFSRLNDGSISWSDVLDTIEETIKRIQPGERSALTSGSGDSGESHLFTRSGKNTDGTADVLAKPMPEKHVSPVSKEEKEYQPEPKSQFSKRPSLKYSLDFIKVSDIPLTAKQLIILGYLRRSANAILGVRTNVGTELFYIGSITNNLIIPNAYHAVKPIFDTAWGTYFLCTVIIPKPDGSVKGSADDRKFLTMSKYIYLSHAGVAEEIPAPVNSHKFTDDSTFKIGDREEAYPEAGEDFVTDAIFQSGQLLWAVEGNVQYLINSDLGTTLGYSASVNLNKEGLVKLSGVSKIFLSRPSLNTVILRDEDSEKEEYVSMKAKLVFERNAPYVAFIGGIVFIGPHGTKTTVSTFLPYEIEFGNIKSLNENNFREFSNGVLFLNDRILFIDSGDYIVQVSQKDLDQGVRGVICINDTLFVTDKVGSI